jgi:hypothetical protein
MLEEVRSRTAAARTSSWLLGLVPMVAIVWGFVAVYLLQIAVDRAGDERMRERLVEELAYFPSGRFIREASIEYQDLAADFVWLRAIQYYGHHMMTDRKYEWLGHVFGILTVLDPAFIGAYHFGAITLAWDARKPQEAIDLLTAGMKANPMHWQLPFDAGFICYTVLKDYEAAGVLFNIASKMPNTWFITGRWAAVAAAKAGDFETARQMWVDIYNGTENRALRALVVRQLRNLKLEEAVERLQQAVRRFREARGRLPADLNEVVASGFIDRVPEEPYGGRFVLDGERVYSTTPASQR